MSGEVDYLLRVVVPDIAAYDAFYKKLIARIEISKVSSAFAMEQIKYTTALPLDFALGQSWRKCPASDAPRRADWEQGAERHGRARRNDVGVAPLETMKSVSGLEFLRRIADGRLPTPPIAARWASGSPRSRKAMRASR